MKLGRIQIFETRNEESVLSRTIKQTINNLFSFLFNFIGSVFYRNDKIDFSNIYKLSGKFLQDLESVHEKSLKGNELISDIEKEETKCSKGSPISCLLFIIRSDSALQELNDILENFAESIQTIGSYCTEVSVIRSKIEKKRETANPIQKLYLHIAKKNLDSITSKQKYKIEAIQIFKEKAFTTITSCCSCFNQSVADIVQDFKSHEQKGTIEEFISKEKSYIKWEKISKNVATIVTRKYIISVTPNTAESLRKIAENVKSFLNDKK